MMKKIFACVSAALLAGTVSAGSIYAFTDLDETEKQPIIMLRDKGIVAGVDSEHFAPRSPISYAQSVSLIVKALALNLSAIPFTQQPQASNYFTNVPNDAWYATAFVIAKANGMDIPANIDPDAVISREKYANLLVAALELKGAFPMVKLLVMFDDNAQIDPMYQGTLQRLYAYRIARLDESRMAYPKREMTRGEAAVWVSSVVNLLEAKSSPANSPSMSAKLATDLQEVVKMTVEQVNADVNKVTLTRTLPNPGYDFSISGIRFQADGTAFVQYQVSEPKPDMMYSQVITEGKAETYISSKYKPVVE